MDLKTKHDLGTKLYQKNILRRKHAKEKKAAQRLRQPISHIKGNQTCEAKTTVS